MTQRTSDLIFDPDLAGDPFFKEVLGSLSGFSSYLIESGFPEDLVYFFEEEICGVVGVDLPVKGADLIVRSLRADFYSDHVLLGDDPTKQFVSPLSVDQEGVEKISYPLGDASKAAKIASKWFQLEFERPLFRYSWQLPGGVHRKYLLGDTRVCILWSDPMNHPRSMEELGKPGLIERLEIGEDLDLPS